MINTALSDAEFMRYSRQLMVTDIAESGQQQLKNTQVLIVGGGGLGSAVGLYLAATGVGTIVIADDDVVDVSNLQRQVLYRAADVGSNKAQAACAQMRALNPLNRYRAVTTRLAGLQLALEVDQADIVVDCSDNFSTRYAINDACFAARKYLVSGAAIGWQGQLMTFDFRAGIGPCYQCLLPQAVSNTAKVRNCRSGGIVGPVVGIIGSMQALAVIKVIVETERVDVNYLSQFDGSQGQWRQFGIKIDQQCSVCGEHSLVNGGIV